MSAIYVSNNLDSFNVLIKNLGNFRERLLHCDNDLVKGIVTSILFMWNAIITTKWQHSLFESMNVIDKMNDNTTSHLSSITAEYT